MTVLVDTNILVSALLYPNSVPAMALTLSSKKYNLILCDYCIAELCRITEAKFPHKSFEIKLLLDSVLYKTVTAPCHPNTLINDPKDAPILNAATLHNVDVIISGDKHFLNLEIEHPKILRAADFLELFR
ncbi:MAG: putative toxin-antitoxin system toxin component, PIN family [Oscillospiraceae bacterium]|nr:putative toxin-antitoxin system toxin component, PIN family [Oscillospiraceae bacterium]